MTTLGRVAFALAALFERLGVIDRHRLHRVVDLAWPRVVTGFARMSQQAVDVAMIGLLVGPAAVAGFAFATAYWQLGNQVALGLSGGTISFVSRYVGADDAEGAGLAVKLSALLGIALALPLSLVFVSFSRPLIDLLGSDAASVGYGAEYLSVLAPAMVFSFLNKIGSRTFAGFDDTVTPMFIRAGAAVLNVVLNVVFMIGLGMGVRGAALGTVLALGAASAAFGYGLIRGRFPGRDPVPVTVSLGRPHVDAEMGRDLITVSLPLMVRRLLRAAGKFPLLAIVAVFGPLVVAAYEIGNRVRGLVNSPTWGLSIAASSLVGQHLGASEEDDADAYGAGILRLTVVTYLAVLAGVLAFAPAIARLFTNDPATIAPATTFVRVCAISVMGWGLDGAITGVLRAGGDTTWPFYATLVGFYLVSLPVAALGAVTWLGVRALYLSIVLETFVPAVIVYHRYRTGHWTTYANSLESTASQD